MPKSVVTTDLLMEPIAHFSHGVRVGNVIHLGATAGTDPTRRLAGTTPGLADMTAQTEQMLRNIETALLLLGGRLEDVVRVKGYITDWRDFATHNEIYVRHFKPPYPSRATVGTGGFPLPQLMLEIELVAVLGGGNRHLASDRLPPALAPYSQGGVRAGDHHYCAVVPADLAGELVGGRDPAAQSERALANLAAILEVAGLTVAEVVMLNVTLADIRHEPAFDEAFRQFFRPPYPARSIVGAPLGLPDLLVELESVAVAGGGRPIEGLGQPPRLGAASPAMLAGDTLYISGQLGLGADGSLPPDAEGQARAAWTRIEALLHEAGLERGDVLRTNNVLVDWRLFGGYNAGYGPFVQAPYPPRATVQASLVDPRAALQIEAIAARGGRDATVLTATGQRRPG